MDGFYQPYWVQPDELEHYGVKGMKWGRVKKKDETPYKVKTSSGATINKANERRQTRLGAYSAKNTSGSSTPYLDRRGGGYETRSRTGNQTNQYNNTFSRVARQNNEFVFNTSTAQKGIASGTGVNVRRLEVTPKGYAVYRSGSDEPITTFSPEEMEELIKSGSGEKYGNVPTGIESFSKEELKDAKNIRNKVEKMTTTIDKGQTAITKAIGSAMKKSVSSVASTKGQKTAKKVLSGASKTLISALKTSIPQKKNTSKTRTKIRK